MVAREEVMSLTVSQCAVVDRHGTTVQILRNAGLTRAVCRKRGHEHSGGIVDIADTCLISADTEITTGEEEGHSASS